MVHFSHDSRCLHQAHHFRHRHRRRLRCLTLGTSLHAADTNLQNLIKAGTTKIVLDLSGVPYIDSAGLGAIVHAYGLAMEFHGTMRLCGINEKVASLLKMTRMDTFLAVDPDSATSLAALS